MSTNYYWVENACPTCKHSSERWHIGKNSGGGFSFQGYSEHDNPLGKAIDCIPRWEEMMQRPNGRIIDEYGEEFSQSRFWMMVADAKAREAARLREGVDQARGYGFQGEQGAHFLLAKFF